MLRFWEAVMLQGSSCMEGRKLCAVFHELLGPLNGAGLCKYMGTTN